MSEQDLLQAAATPFDEYFKEKSVRAIEQEEKDYFIVSIETPTTESIKIRVAISNKFIDHYSKNNDELKKEITSFVQQKINETLKNYERVEYLPEGQRIWVLNL